MQNEKRYFLKNSNLLEEVHKSKLTYCCYEKPEYGHYDTLPIVAILFYSG